MTKHNQKKCSQFLESSYVAEIPKKDWRINISTLSYKNQTNLSIIVFRLSNQQSTDCAQLVIPLSTSSYYYLILMDKSYLRELKKKKIHKIKGKMHKASIFTRINFFKQNKICIETNYRIVSTTFQRNNI